MPFIVLLSHCTGHECGCNCMVFLSHSWALKSSSCPHVFLRLYKAFRELWCSTLAWIVLLVQRSCLSTNISASSYTFYPVLWSAWYVGLIPLAYMGKSKGMFTTLSPDFRRSFATPPRTDASPSSVAPYRHQQDECVEITSISFLGEH